MKQFKKLFGYATVLAIMSLTPHESLYAYDDSGGKAQARASRIVGLWDVEVVVEHCVTGAPLFSFPALHQFHLGGTGEIVPAGSPTAVSAHMMVWSHVEKDDYQATAKFFRYDSAGNTIGWVILRNDITLNNQANEYVGAGAAEVYDAAGNFLFQSCPSLMATRFTGA